MAITQQVLDLAGISKSYGDKVVLEDLSLSINHGDRIGLVGENGTGKTTLANIILGIVQSEAGRRRIPPGVEIGYLPQEAQVEEDTTLQTFLENATGGVHELQVRLSSLEEQMSTGSLPKDALASMMEQYGEVQEEFLRRGGYDGTYRFDQVLAGLDLDQIDRSLSLRSLSGGEKTRAMLARLLLSAPNLLILDEPTNHLDFAAIDWLEAYLLSYQGAVLAISHDRHFLNKVVSQIIELSPVNHKLSIYHGNYDYFLAERERLRTQQVAVYEAQQEEIKELQRLIKAKTHSTKAMKPPSDDDKFQKTFRQENVDRSAAHEIRDAKRRLAELEENRVERPVRRWHINPNFMPEDLVSRDVIRLKDVSKAYDGRALFEDVTAVVRGGERVVLQGPNGVGKTTLVKLILGLERPDTGEIKIASGANIGYLDQEQETLDPECTVLDAYCQGLGGPEAEHRANLHRYGLFAGDQVHQKIASLSTGQRRKLQIARLIARKANMLILDEPTNHLDLESVEQFERALCEFPGTILAITHDRYFIERVATEVWSIQAARLVVSRP